MKISKENTLENSPERFVAAPTFDEYSNNFVKDGRLGAERRQTIDDLPLAESSLSSEPLVSIITIVFNNHTHIDRAIWSVLAQKYRNLEYILIDGGSTDGTVYTIGRYAELVSYWHSAKDGSIADAFERGVALAQGDIIGLVNADDWMSLNQVATGVAALGGTGSPCRKFLYSDDMADACIFLLELDEPGFEKMIGRDDSSDWPLVNTEWGEDVTIAELATAVACAVGFEGKIQFDASFPDGTPRKLLDTRRLSAAGRVPRTRLETGLLAAVADFRAVRDAASHQPWRLRVHRPPRR